MNLNLKSFLLLADIFFIYLYVSGLDGTQIILYNNSHISFLNSYGLLITATNLENDYYVSIFDGFAYVLAITAVTDFYDITSVDYFHLSLILILFELMLKLLRCLWMSLLFIISLFHSTFHRF